MTSSVLVIAIIILLSAWEEALPQTRAPLGQQLNVEERAVIPKGWHSSAVLKLAASHSLIKLPLAQPVSKSFSHPKFFSIA